MDCNGRDGRGGDHPGGVAVRAMNRNPEQSELFGSAPARSSASIPEGWRYAERFLDEAEESALLDCIGAMELRQAEYKQYTARRRIVSFGGKYDFTQQRLLSGEPMPAWLYPLRDKAGQWADLDNGTLSFCLIAEYSPGTPLGWHRDVADFESVVGTSLAGSARMRFRRYPPQRDGSRPARAEFAVDLAPRSIYTLQGESRWNWQHAVSPTKELRYSITFRSRRAGAKVSPKKSP
jgi:alkylated DNA repair dioxygenase AlkB